MLKEFFFFNLNIEIIRLEPERYVFVFAVVNMYCKTIVKTHYIEATAQKNNSKAIFVKNSFNVINFIYR